MAFNWFRKKKEEDPNEEGEAASQTPSAAEPDEELPSPPSAPEPETEKADHPEEPPAEDMESEPEPPVKAEAGGLFGRLRR